MNIRTDEKWLVKRLFLLQFLQGAGIAFFFTAAFALFLARMPITELPYVYIYASILLWIVGLIYSRIEHQFKIINLAIMITVFMVLSMMLFRLSFMYIKTGWFLYWMLAWFNVLYLLNNLEFWGIASLLFDARQSKRLFGVISAGDIPAKFIGYTLALFAVDYIGTINLLWAGIICMLASIPFLLSIKKSGMLLEVQHKIQTKHTRHGMKKIVKNFSGNALIRRLAILGVLITGSFLIINFAFYAEVKEAYHDDVALAKFIAFFLAIVRIIALFVKMIFTGRLINNLGIIKSLLITPVVMLLLISSIVLTQDLQGYQRIILYLFGATSIVVDILRSSINSPVFLTIMQPLSNHERLKAHTIVKGIMDPFASFFTGVMLLLLIHYEEKVDLLTLSYILLAICILWIIGIYRVNSQYLKTIIKSISSRYFNQENFTIRDSGTLEWAKEKVLVGSEIEVINLLNMLYSSNIVLSDEMIISILNHPSDQVKLTLLRLIRQKNMPSVDKYLVSMLQKNTNPLIVGECIKIWSMNPEYCNVILPYLEHEEPAVRQATLEGLFFNGTGDIREKAAAKLQQMLFSENDIDRMMLSEILSSREKCNEIKMILQLMNDRNANVRKKAFIAAGRSGNHQLLQELINSLGNAESEVIHALFIAGESALPYMVAFLSGNDATSLQKEKLILLCGRIGGERAWGILVSMLVSNPEAYMDVIKALYRSNYIIRDTDQDIFISIAKKLLMRSASIIYMQNYLLSKKEKYLLLINSFYLEQINVRDLLLYVFAILYSRDNINKVRSAYATENKESIINAMEIIDFTVRKDLAIHFNIIFEPGNIMERMHALEKNYPVEYFENEVSILVRILEEELSPFNNWTLACSLYTLKKQQFVIDDSLIKKYANAENILLRETALFAM